MAQIPRDRIFIAVRKADGSEERDLSALSPPARMRAPRLLLRIFFFFYSLMFFTRPERGPVHKYRV